MAGEATSIQAKVSYAVAATRPSTAASYTKLTGIKSVSAINAEPSQLDSTTFDNQTYRSYELGLIDAGGSCTLTANNTDTFQTEWEALVTAEAAGAIATPQTYAWFCVEIKGLANAFYFRGKPVALGLNDLGVDEIVEVDAYVSLSEVVGWDAKPTP